MTTRGVLPSTIHTTPTWQSIAKKTLSSIGIVSPYARGERLQRQIVALVTQGVNINAIHSMAWAQCTNGEACRHRRTFFWTNNCDCKHCVQAIFNQSGRAFHARSVRLPSKIYLVWGDQKPPLGRLVITVHNKRLQTLLQYYWDATGTTKLKPSWNLIDQAKARAAAKAVWDKSCKGFQQKGIRFLHWVVSVEGHNPQHPNRKDFHQPWAGQNYMMAMIHVNSNAVLAKSMKNLSTKEMIQAYLALLEQVRHDVFFTR